MLDARNIYRKVTRKIYDFSPDKCKTCHHHLALSRTTRPISRTCETIFKPRLYGERGYW